MCRSNAVALTSCWFLLLLLLGRGVRRARGAEVGPLAGGGLLLFVRGAAVGGLAVGASGAGGLLLLLGFLAFGVGRGGFLVRLYLE